MASFARVQSSPGIQNMDFCGTGDFLRTTSEPVTAIEVYTHQPYAFMSEKQDLEVHCCNYYPSVHQSQPLKQAVAEPLPFDGQIPSSFPITPSSKPRGQMVPIEKSVKAAATLRPKPKAVGGTAAGEKAALKVKAELATPQVVRSSSECFSSSWTPSTDGSDSSSNGDVSSADQQIALEELDVLQRPVSQQLKRSNKVVDRIRGILNRITQKTFATLTEEMWMLLQRIKSPKTAYRVVEIIFEVALDQADFSRLPADICAFLWNKIKAQKATAEEGQELPLQDFRRMLLTKCQQTFLASCMHMVVIPEGITEEQRADILHQDKVCQRRGLANVTFMAQLFERSLLNQNIIHSHVLSPLLHRDYSNGARCWLLEYVLRVFELVGRQLDHSAAKEVMDEYFLMLSDLSQQLPSPRVKCLILNILDLRRFDWQTREQRKIAVIMPTSSGARVSPETKEAAPMTSCRH